MRMLVCCRRCVGIAIVSYSELRHLCRARCAHCSAVHSIYVVIVSWLDKAEVEIRESYCLGAVVLT
jgi:hypothetical protein